jgi:predicted ribonuclease YlaK
MKHIFVFIDTMIFLHYRTIEEINFPELLKVDSISIIVSRITLRELDEQKNIHAQSKIRERAKKVLNKIEEWIKTENSIRPKVDIKYYSSIPNINFEKHGLNQNWNDDYLLATILQYREENPAHNVLLISQDSGPRLTAHHLNISSIELPQEFKLPIESDPLEIENRELKRTLAKIQSALPQLVVCFSGREKAESNAYFSLEAPSNSMEDEIEKEIAELTRKYPKRYPSNSKNIDNKNILATLALNIIIPTPIDEYERYNKDVEKYIIQYKSYLKASWKKHEITKRSINFQIEIRNIGTAPAEDVDIYLHFPDGFVLMEGDSLPATFSKKTRATH